jgi:hypothetical protein
LPESSAKQEPKIKIDPAENIMVMSRSIELLIVNSLKLLPGALAVGV